MSFRTLLIGNIINCGNLSKTWIYKILPYKLPPGLGIAIKYRVSVIINPIFHRLSTIPSNCISRSISSGVIAATFSMFKYKFRPSHNICL